MILFFQIIALTILTSQAVMADLGPADIPANVIAERKLLKTKYEVWCGQARETCNLQFDQGLLKFNNSSGISPEQVQLINLNRWCRSRSGCGFPMVEVDFTIKYFDSSENSRVAYFRHINFREIQSLYSDLEVWSGGKMGGWIPSQDPNKKRLNRFGRASE